MEAPVKRNLSCNCLPFSLESEQALLGAMLCVEAARQEIQHRLRSEDFFVTEHQNLFARLAGLRAPVDLGVLESDPVFSRLGGYYRWLAQQAAPVEEVPKLIRDVHRFFVLRRLRQAQLELGLEFRFG